LWFFIEATITDADGFFALKLETAGACRAGLASPTCRLQAFRRRSGCVPAEPYPPLKQCNFTPNPRIEQRKSPKAMQYSTFDRTLSGFARTVSPVLIAPRQMNRFVITGTHV
jgi:hypothetical protein